ncbi:hypothetical protein [Mesoterricola silvestris]|uniref:Uncharacterized protein n=1 Tax=Mesoterricola silvestris TaxID=2927979 RepID=A0AA48GM26_9BACT|nr:hypothetical protein [Mesoterricola silvestris]BDU72329.1 hypothetical protein METEAL_15030 [Mesoterricola silvestris]
MPMQTYKIKETYLDHPAGSTVYDLMDCDYGCSAEDSMDSGEDYAAVTLDPTGNYPFFTIPTRLLKAVT